METTTYDLHGKPVTRLVLGVRYAWAGEQLALAIGYHNSSGLSSIMGGQAGEHFDMLAGEDSVALATAMRGQASGARRMLVYYAAGLLQAHRNLLARRRTEKAALLAEVLTEAGVPVDAPAPTAVETPQPVARPVAPVSTLPVVRAASADDLADAMRASFERHPLTVLTYRDMPAFIGTEVARALGYDERSFATRLNEWADEIGEGLVKVEGADLAALKAMLGADETDDDELVTPNVTSGVGARSRSLYLLTEAGLNAVLLKTNKPEGKRLRAFLATEVLPEIRRTGTYVMRRKAPEIDLGLQKADLLRDLAKMLGTDTYAGKTFAVYAGGLALGRPVDHLLPAAVDHSRSTGEFAAPGTGMEPIGESMTCEELSRFLGLSPQQVGKVRLSLGLVGTKPGLTVERDQMAPDGKTWKCVCYFPEAQQRIADECRRRNLTPHVDMALMRELKRKGRLISSRNHLGNVCYRLPDQLDLPAVQP